MAKLDAEDIELIINGVADKVLVMLSSGQIDLLKSKITNTPVTASAATLNDIMDIPGVAEYLGVSKRFINQAVKERNLPFFKVGRLTKFRRSEVDEHISRRAIKASYLCGSDKLFIDSDPSNVWTWTEGAEKLQEIRAKLAADMRKNTTCIVEGISDYFTPYRVLLRKSAILRKDNRHINNTRIRKRLKKQ
jgi:excisionase family DNA binding protein